MRDGFVEHRGQDPPSHLGSLAGSLPTALIVLALLALLFVPAVLQREVSEVREEIHEAADPARAAMTQVQYLLARQTSSLRGYFISRDPEYLRQYRTLAEEEEQVQARLARLLPRLGDEVSTYFVELRTLSEEWHAELETELRGAMNGTGGPIPYQWDRYLAALRVASELDDALADAVRQRQDRIDAAEAKARWLQAGLGVLALAAALAAAWLSHRVQRLATEAEFRHREAERALAETARAVESKARLIQGVTHDVKNPLGAADGYAELLELGVKGPLAPAQAQMVVGIRRSIRGALEIIRELLDLARAETGSIVLDRRPVPLGAVVEEAVEQYRGSAAARGHHLELVVGGPDPVSVTDAARVREILGNLLSNAIKYTPREGRIRVSVGLECRIAGPGPGRWAVVRVADEGPGIRPEDQERIFDEFQRLSGSTEHGHGLGLTISRRIARLLEGEITVQSTVGQGSTFLLWLPAEGAEAG